MSLLEQFKKHPTRRKELVELLREPAMVDAIAIIKEGLYTLKSPPMGGSYDLMQYYGLYGAKQMGYMEALTNLLDLANLSPARMPDRKPWDTVNKDAIAKKMEEEINPA